MVWGIPLEYKGEWQPWDKIILEKDITKKLI